MGPKFKMSLMMGGTTDEPLDIISSNQKFRDDDEIRRDKLKDL